jgi:sterol 3beta-glucosyltransferase
MSFELLVSAVCHHGGSGTTATALRAGKPTIILPFFGDQYFWGNNVMKNGVGPTPIPGKNVTAEELAEALKFVHREDVQMAARNIQEILAAENGCQIAMESFHAHLPVTSLTSDFESTYSACFRLDEYRLQVSRPVAQVLLSANLVKPIQFRYLRTRLWLSAIDDKRYNRIVTIRLDPIDRF